MAEKDYELLEHTADIYVRFKAKDLKSLFENAARGMFDIAAEIKSGAKSQESGVNELSIKLKADGLDELFINWLNDLLSLSATKEQIFSRFEINKLDNNNLEAIVFGRDLKNYKINTEIKAATYHELKLQRTDSGWIAEVIFDV